MSLPLQTDKHAERRLSALTDLFNAFHGEPKTQLQIVLAIIAYAQSSSSLAGLLALALKVENLLMPGEPLHKPVQQQALSGIC